MNTLKLIKNQTLLSCALVGALSLFLQGQPTWAAPSCPLDPAESSLSRVKAMCRDATEKNFYETKDKLSNASFGGPYYLSLSPDLEDTKQALEDQIASFDQVTKGYPTSYDQFISSLQEAYKTSPKLSSTFAKRAQEIKKNISSNRNYQNTMYQLFQEQLGDRLACQDGNKQCKKAYNTTLKKMGSVLLDKPAGYISIPDTTTEVLADPIYQRALSYLALTMLDKYLNNRGVSNPSALGSLWDDTIAAFKKVGVKSEAEAKGRALKALAVIATRGASMDPLYKIAPEELKLTAGAMGVIATVSRGIDLISGTQGYMYSLPTNVQKTVCDYSRPYHFWLPAYLAWDLKTQGHSKAAAQKALHEVSLQYEQFAGLAVRTKDTKGHSKAYLDETLKNVIFNDAGAYWGSNLGVLDAKQSKIIDRSFITNNISKKTEKTKATEGIYDTLQALTSFGYLDLDNAFALRNTLHADAHLELFK